MRPYKCVTCDAKFSQICSLNVHEMNVQDSSMPCNYTEQEATRALGGHELIEVEQGMKTDPDECCGISELAKQWTVFPGGMLKEFKPEHDGRGKKLDRISWWRIERSQNRTRRIDIQYICAARGSLRECWYESDQYPCNANECEALPEIFT